MISRIRARWSSLQIGDMNIYKRMIFGKQYHCFLWWSEQTRLYFWIAFAFDRIQPEPQLASCTLLHINFHNCTYIEILNLINNYIHNFILKSGLHPSSRINVSSCQISLKSVEQFGRESRRYRVTFSFIIHIGMLCYTAANIQSLWMHNVSQNVAILQS